MAFDDRGIGGQVRPTEASEAIADIPQNRTLLVEQLTADAPVKPEIVEGLKTVEEVFEHYQPELEVAFEDAEGGEVEETLKFKNLGDFGKKGIIAQSAFLQDLQMQQENYQQFIKFLRSNKILQKMLADPDAKAAYLAALQSMILEIEATES
ncbi:MAG: hypothetical protein D6730_16575 [Bacteroidetes bacterium]|nr:MAG: hypothetical protein D6730_16575 [Bacteroidota bacterium]